MWPFEPSMPKSPPKPSKKDPWTEYLKAICTLPVQHPVPTAASAVISVLAVLSLRRVSKRYFSRLKSSEWITPDIVAEKRWIRGYVTNVGDADNFRLYHTPGFGWRRPLRFRHIPKTPKELKDQTIHIRLSGIDAPEAGHFGRTEQLYAKDALAWLKLTVENRFVYCQITRKDQYGRVVAHVHLPHRVLPGSFRRGRSVSKMMLRAGWAVIYDQAGAEYTVGGIGAYKSELLKAKWSKSGMWAFGELEETPAEWKKRYRELEAAGAAEAEKAEAKAKPGTRKRRGLSILSKLKKLVRP